MMWPLAVDMYGSSFFNKGLHIQIAVDNTGINPGES